MTHTIDSLMDEINTLRKEIARLQYAERFHNEVAQAIDNYENNTYSAYQALTIIGARLDELDPDYNP